MRWAPQHALTRAHCASAGLRVLASAAPAVDIVEIGTPLLIAEGLGAVRAVCSAHPGMIVLADTKIMDAGGYEARLAFEAGADIVTVLG